MYKKIISLIVILVLAGNVLAANVWWVGNYDDDWSNDLNWVPWAPDDTDLVNITDGASYYNSPGECVIYSGTNAHVSDFGMTPNIDAGTVDSNLSLTIKSGASLTSNVNFDLGYYDGNETSTLNVEQGGTLTVVSGYFLNWSRPGPQIINVAGTINALGGMGFVKDSSIVINFTERTGKIVVAGDLSERWYIDWWCGFWLDRGVERGEPVDPNWEITYGFTSSYDDVNDLTTFKSVKYVENAFAAVDPVPDDNAVDVPVAQVLSWQPPLKSSGDTLTYKVYLSTDSGSMGTGTDVSTATAYTPPSDLLPATGYYWRVDVTDANFGGPVVITGDVWTFDTVQVLAPILVSPSDSDTPEIDPATVTLSWTSNASAITHLVYLRLRDDTWDLVDTITAPAATSYSPSSLLWGEAYDWRVDEVFSGPVTITGPTWKFHTVTPVCNGGELLAGDGDGDCDVDFIDFALMAENWLDCAYDPIEACGSF